MKAILCSFFCLAAINLMADVNATNADEQGEALLKDRYAEYYSYFHGTWEIEITKDGETETRVNESRPSQQDQSESTGADSQVLLTQWVPRLCTDSLRHIHPTRT